MSGRVRLKENNILDEDLPSLLEIVFKFLSENLSVVCDENKFDHNLELNEGVYIPNEICDRLLKYYQDCNQDINNHFIYIFRDTTRTPLKYVSLRNSSITDEGMEILLRHNLISLSMWYCDSVTTNSWRTLLEHSSQLKCLELGQHVDLLKFSEPNEKTPIDFQLNLPQLRRLTLNAVVLQPTLQFR
ncbi:Protein zer-1 homolog [Sergentomyia squamirostris]